MAKNNPGAAYRHPLRSGALLSPIKQAWAAGVLRVLASSLALAAVPNSHAAADEQLRLAVQKTGTFAWELAIIREQGFDKKAGLDLNVMEFASPEAAKIALLGGATDVILSDWLWVARQRSLGNHLVFVPHSAAIGAVMIPPNSQISTLTDLAGRKIAVAGGPLDKSWLLLQAYAHREGFDIAKQAKVIFGAPALLQQTALDGEADAILNYWNFCLALEGRGFRRLIGIDEVEKHLGAKEPVAMVGFVFAENFAKTHTPAFDRFFTMVSEARRILVQSQSEWEKIAGLVGVKDEQQLERYRDTYVNSLPNRTIGEEAADARVLYGSLVRIGGSEVTGAAKELDEEIYFKGGPELVPNKN
ncbi:MAG TPA: ABC transporter substrate-binding protein [Methylocella sp.]|nr:ABC transporter substrate-binding protein [Methylocella sp.]